MDLFLGTSREAIHFLSKESDAIVRMRGLPFSTSAKDIVRMDWRKQSFTCSTNLLNRLLCRNRTAAVNAGRFPITPH